MMNKSDIKILLIGVIIISLVDPFYVLIDTIIAFAEIESYSLSFCLLYSYSPFLIAGLYIGCSRAKKVTTICFLVSSSYVLERIIFQGLLNSDSRHGILDNKFLIIANLLLLGFLITIGSSTLARNIKHYKKT